MSESIIECLFGRILIDSIKYNNKSPIKPVAI